MDIGVTEGFPRWYDFFSHDFKIQLPKGAPVLIFVMLCFQICYFFYKNIVFGVTLFIYEAYASFSGTPAYNDWFMSVYNVFFTSLPAIALGVFDQDVSARLCLKVDLYFNVP